MFYFFLSACFSELFFFVHLSLVFFSPLDYKQLGRDDMGTVVLLDHIFSFMTLNTINLVQIYLFEYHPLHFFLSEYPRLRSCLRTWSTASIVSAMF